jgi:hypothetical protein
MKKLLFSLIIGICIAALTFFSIKNSENKIFAKVIAVSSKVHSTQPFNWIESKINTPSLIPTAYHDTTLNGVYSFIVLWIILAFILGIKPFLSGFRAFFPLKA